MRVKKLTALVLSVVMLLAMVPAMSVSAADIESGLLLHYTFDGDPSSPSTIADSSGNGYDGTVLNTEQQSWFGGGSVSQRLTIESNMARFPGGASVESPWGNIYYTGAAIKIPESVKSAIPGDYTVSMWVKADSGYAYNDGLQRFFDFGVDLRDSIFFRYTNSTGEMRFQDRGIVNDGEDEAGFISETNNAFTDKWGLLTVTYNAETDTAVVYINGSEVMSDTGKFTRSISDLGELTDETYGMFLGRTQWYSDWSQQSNNPDFCGYMDDVRIYGRALSAEDVAELYSATYRSPDMQAISSGTEITLTTEVGQAPALPETVEVTFADGSTAAVSVVWDSVDPSLYAEEGRYTVAGAVSYGGYDYGEIMTATVTVGGNDLDDGLVVYYSFENDEASPAVIHDDSGSGNDGTAYNNGEWREDRRKELSIENGIAYFPGRFDSRRGGAYIKIPEAARSGIQDYTISMWVKADSTYKYNENLQRFFDFGIATDDSIFVRYTNSTGDLRFQDRGIGGGADDQNSLMSTTNTSFNDSWALLTVVYTKEDTTATVYVNGEEVMSDDKFTRSIGDIGELTNDSYGMLIGRTQWNDHTNPDFCGWMDEVRLYNRAISEEEIDILYNTTNPEPMVEVDITYTLEDGTVIHSEADTAGENTRYAYEAPATFEYDGVVYNLSYRLSTLTIDSLTETNNQVNAVYVIKSLENVSSFEAEVYRGTAPELPETALLTYNTGEIEAVDIEWNAYDEENLQSAGSFEITGTAGGYTVTLTVTVFEITEVEAPIIVYTSIGETPTLPETVNVRLSNREDWTAIRVQWEEIPEGSVDEAGEFTVMGTEAEYGSGTEIECTVVVILEAVTEVTAVADVYTSTENTGRNFGGENGLIISNRDAEHGAAGNTRYAFVKFENEGIDALEAKLKIYVQRVENNADTTFYAFPVDSSWEEYGLTWDNQDEIVNSAGAVLDQVTIYPDAQRYYVNDYIEFDVSDYIAENPDLEYYSFLITCSTCATYANARENGENPPVIAYVTEGRYATVNYVYDGQTVYSEEIVASAGDYEYSGFETYTAGSDGVYVSGAGPHILAAGSDELTIPVTPAGSFEFDEISVDGYVGEDILPESVRCVVDGNETYFDVVFDVQSYDEAGTYYPVGYAGSYPITAEVKAYEPYLNARGEVIGYAGVIHNYFVDEDGSGIADVVSTTVPVGSVYNADSEILGYYPQVSGAYQTTEPFEVTEPVHQAGIAGELIYGVSGAATAEINVVNHSNYTLTVNAKAANTGDETGNAKVIITSYDSEGAVVDVELQTAQLPANMTGREDFSLTIPYDAENPQDIRIYLWDGDSIRPLASTIYASELEVPEYSDTILALIPEYDDVVENVTRANNYRQSTWGPTSVVNGIDIAFWDTATYHTGNMEAYFTFGDEAYKQYSMDWANDNNWMGNENSDAPDSWTWGYSQSQGSNAVLFGDWQTCFQSYLDLYLVDPENSDISHVEEVMGYQITKEDDSFWWWADALYMVPPVMTKLYLATGNEGYLDALYKYYRFAAELMYDGENGIPTSEDGYTTTAKESKRNGSAYSDPNDYKHLFFRDAGYVYPLQPNPGHEDEKNFWARGNGWVFAGLAKILTDLPSDYEHYGFFLTIYEQMAEAIIACQKVDADGNGFWTQSMLQNYPIGNNGNDEGYETSGTAFMTYGLFWGINSGILDEGTYLEPALRGWKYLSEVALLEDGRVGYCQPIGSNATQATGRDTTQPFGFGAFLLAGSEVSRWVGGVTENNAPYLQRKLWSAVAFSGDRYYSNGNVTTGSASFTENDTLYVPLYEVAEALGFSVEETTGGYTVSNVSRSAMVLSQNIVERDGTVFVSASALAAAMGKYVSTYGDATVISHKTSVFYDCDENSVVYLNELLAE